MGAMLVLALLLAACGPAATTTPAVEPTTAIPEPATEAATEMPTEAATESATEAATEATTEAATEAATGVPVTGATTVSVSESADFGPILVDGEGMSLYVFLADTQNGGTSACGADDGCVTEWPPLGSEGAPAAGEGLDGALLGTITRDDGTMQVTYNGWPLYHYAGDAAPGDTNGQALNEFGGVWYLVSPAGEAILQ